MGLTKDQLVSAMDIAKMYTQDELKEASMRFNAIAQALYELGTGAEPEGPFELIHSNVGLEDSPIGQIISFMGTSAPTHYLACDGSTYNIADYPYLAEHIKKHFGSINNFGGDGETTFAVPDLRGEFLRGTGQAEGRVYKGSDVGKHQEATYTRPVHVNSWMENGKMMSGVYYFHETASGSIEEPAITGYDDATQPKRDTVIVSNTIETIETNPYIPNCIAKAAFRPTNTSILYCIKAEHTYYIRSGASKDYYEVDGDKFSEQCIGTFNGKKLYRVTVKIPYTSNATIYPYEIENIDDVIRIGGAINAINITERSSFPISYSEHLTPSFATCYYKIGTKEFRLFLSDNILANNGHGNAIITIEYTKTV